jgi:hypothetical protein
MDEVIKGKEKYEKKPKRYKQGCVKYPSPRRPLLISMIACLRKAESSRSAFVTVKEIYAE